MYYPLVRGSVATPPPPLVSHKVRQPFSSPPLLCTHSVSSERGKGGEGAQHTHTLERKLSVRVRQGQREGEKGGKKRSELR